ncbi:MAG: hypothetical protein O3A00_19235 [Planctomycetota bacterium]|nr:hypothetical protein [Planctomycetota bacterium]
MDAPEFGSRSVGQTGQDTHERIPTKSPRADVRRNDNRQSVVRPTAHSEHAVDFRAMWLGRRSFEKRANRELGGQAFEFQIWRFAVVGEFRVERPPNLKWITVLRTSGIPHPAVKMF